ncbi:DNA replication licensing factor MCM2 [Cardamine amara subsp. amara]|uniref:DNA replication licensing factor MCM2 n=1 Tax=Cardamine amara subsp. amara TaxID=228776 RepID=A0ABD1BIC2_CARAN
MAGEDKQPSSPALTSSAGFNTDQSPFSTNQNSENFVYEERDLGEIMRRRLAAIAQMEARETQFNNRKFPHLLDDNDPDDWNHRPSKRFRTMVPRRGNGGGDPSSLGGSQPDISMTDETDDYQDDDGNDDEAEFEMYRIQGTLRELVMRDEVRRFIAKKFKDFLLTYVKPKNENGDIDYVRLINEMVSANKCSLEIDYKEFMHVHPNIAIWLADAPQPVLEVMEEVSEKVIFDLHPNYKNFHQKIYVRVTNLPVNDQIRNISFHAI